MLSDSFRAAHGESVLFGTGFTVTFVSTACGKRLRMCFALLEIIGEIRALWHRIEPEHACLSMACGIADGFFFSGSCCKDWILLVTLLLDDRKLPQWQ